MRVPGADHPPAAILAWDSGFWQVPVAELTGPFDAARIDAGDLWCREQDVAVAYLRIEAGNAALLSGACRLGFDVLETTIVLGRTLAAGLVPTEGVRPAGTTDAAATAEIARTDLRGTTRFYRDPGFPDAGCDGLYAEWARASIAGWADASFVAEQEGRTVGFVTAHRSSHGRLARVGLLVIGEGTPWQRVARARALLTTAFAHLAEMGEVDVTLATQAHNRATLQLLQMLGCTTRSFELRLHKWYPRSGAPVRGARA